MGAKYHTPLAAAVAYAGERESLALRRALTRCGISSRVFQRWQHGHGRPAPWVKNAIAEALGTSAEQLWPKSAAGDSGRAPWRPVR